MKENESVVLTCKVSESNRQARWYKDSSRIASDDPRYVTDSDDCDFSLAIPNTKPEDSGEFMVKVADVQSTAHLQVLGELFLNSNVLDFSEMYV